jgi:hypothetical protein
MNHDTIDRRAAAWSAARQHDADTAVACERVARQQECDRRARRYHHRPVAVRTSGTLYLHQPRLHLLFGRPFAWIWLGLIAPSLLLFAIVPWWGALLAVVPCAIPWAWNALSLSATITVTPARNADVWRGLLRTATCPARDLQIELNERGMTGWLGECIIKQRFYPIARILGLTEHDMAAVTGFASSHGIAVERSKYNYSVTVSC